MSPIRAKIWIATMKIMTKKFSPSALHQGSVQGCFSANADLLMQDPPWHTKFEILAWTHRRLGRKGADRPTKMCGLRKLRPDLSNGGNFDRSGSKQGGCQ